MDTFTLDPDTNILVCLLCEAGISPGKKVEYHLNSNHRHQIEPVLRLELKRRWEKVAAEAPADLVKRGQAQKIVEEIQRGTCSLFRHLKVEPGFACTVKGCTYCGRSVETVKKHREETHKDDVDVGGRQDRRVFVTSLFHGNVEGLPKYFEVQPGPVRDDAGRQGGRGVAQDGRDVPQGARDVALRDYADACRERDKMLAVVPERPDRVNLWDQRTGWPRHFAGLDMVEARKLAVGPADEAPWCARLRRVVVDYIQRCDGRLRDVGVLLAQYMYSEDGEPADQPMRPVSLRSTLAEYARLWSKLVVFLVRLGEEGAARWRVPLSEEQRRLLRKIEAGRRSWEGEDGDGTVERLVVELSRAVLRQRLGTRGMASPLLVFLGILGFDADRRIWKHAAECSPVLSQAIYLLRLVGLDDFLDRQEGRDDTELQDRLVEYRKTCLVKASDSVFHALYSLRKYAMVVAVDFYGHPSIHWRRDGEALWHKKDLLELSSIRRWFQSLITHGEGQLKDLLGGRDDLAFWDPGRMDDWLAFANNGASLCDFNEDLQKTVPFFVRRQEADPDGRWSEGWSGVEGDARQRARREASKSPRPGDGGRDD